MRRAAQPTVYCPPCRYKKDTTKPAKGKEIPRDLLRFAAAGRKAAGRWSGRGRASTAAGRQGAGVSRTGPAHPHGACAARFLRYFPGKQLQKTHNPRFCVQNPRRTAAAGPIVKVCDFINLSHPGHEFLSSYRYTKLVGRGSRNRRPTHDSSSHQSNTPNEKAPCVPQTQGAFLPPGANGQSSGPPWNRWPGRW